MTKQSIIHLMACLLLLPSNAQRLDRLPLSTSLDTNALNSVVVEADGSQTIVLKSEDGIWLYSSDYDRGLEGIYVNDVPLTNLLERMINARLDNKTFIKQFVNVPESHSENPLWGKKMSVVGDSEVAGSSYAYYIQMRNNMVMVNHAIGGTALVGTKESNALFPNYRDWISADSDYILVQIGCNDDSTWNPADDDDSTNTNVFKGAWNVFLQNMKSEYPNAKKAMVMPYYWSSTGGRDARVAWMKTRCDKYSLEYIDGVLELGFSPTNQPQYFQENEDHTPNQFHFTALGHQRASYIYENFLKTRVQISK